MRPLEPERIELAPGLVVPRLITGLWQVADMEKEGTLLDPQLAARDLLDYARAGFDAFDMADHYGSAELITGEFLKIWKAQRPAHAFTKWCPEPGAMSVDRVRAGVDERCARLGVDRVDLLQFHWWDYTHPAYLDAIEQLMRLREQGQILHLGLTNFDTDHLHLLRQHGAPIVTNQVSFSLLDRRAAGRMSDLCLAQGIRLLAYGTLAGGFLSERWLGKAEPLALPDWSKSKYQRFIDAIGGWDAFQGVLQAAHAIAQKHDVSISAVSLRWVLEQAAVGAVIVGARLGESEHRASNLAVFGFALDAQDQALLRQAFALTQEPPGDCGDEYRKPPFLTASGDLSHHLKQLQRPFSARSVAGLAQRSQVSSGSQWESFGGYSRAVRQGSRIMVSGTTATHGAGQVVAPGNAQAQTVFILDKIAASLQALGSGLEDVVRTRIYLRDIAAWQGPTEVHGRVFADVRPANTVLAVAQLVGDYEVEIEAEAEIPPMPRSFVRTGSVYEAMAGYSRAVIDGPWAFVSGTVGADMVTGQWPQGAVEQARRAIDTIETALAQAGFCLMDVVRVTVHVAKREDITGVCEVIAQCFGPASPANTTLCTPLAVPECEVEIEVTAYRPTH
ncbi:MAG: aldo/keto reductase [Betaproteobacteria bacterium]|nr:aldo/keto reductase [Betaproteobacteria bacterium]